MGLAPVNAMEGWPPRTQKVTVLGMAQAPQDVPPGSGPVPLYRRLLPMPSSLGVGLECHAWRSLGSQTYPLQQDGPGWQPESDWVKAGRPRSGAVKMASCHHLSEPVSATWADSTPFQCKRPSDPRWCPLCPSWGQGSPPATLRESTPGSQCWQEKETSQRTNGRETKVRDTQAALWQVDWQADWGRSLWSLANAGTYCRGFSQA